MSKKDYIALAKLIKGNAIHFEDKPDVSSYIKYGGFLFDLCQYLKSDNPNFNESKFREACGE